MLGIGIVGSGFMGLTYSEAITRHVTGAKLIAIAGGRRCKQLADEYKVPALSVDALLDRKDIQAIILATPDHCRLELASKAALAGKHILAEKPMASSLSDCNAMIAACNDVTLAVVKTERFRKVTQAAKLMIDNGELGQIRMVRTLSSFPISTTKEIMPPDSYMRHPHSGGLFMGMATHNADFLRWITGAEVIKVFAQATTYSDLASPHQSVMAHLTFDSGAMGQMWISSEFPSCGLPDSEVRFQIVGSKGILDLENFKFLDATVNNKWQRVYTPEQFDYLKEPRSAIRLYPHKEVVQEFVNSIKDGRPPKVGGTEGREAVKICEACLLSAQLGQAITVAH